MNRNMTIVHMDDEYVNMISIYPMDFSYIVCIHWIENENLLDAHCIADEVPNAFAEETNTKMYQFHCPNNSGATYRYLFCGGTELPESANEFLTDSLNIFVVDILRQSSSGTGGEVVAQQTIDGLKANNGAQATDIILFTALQGPETEKIVKDNPGVELIRKLDVEALESRWGKTFRASLGHA